MRQLKDCRNTNRLAQGHVTSIKPCLTVPFPPHFILHFDCIHHNRLGQRSAKLCEEPDKYIAPQRPSGSCSITQYHLCSLKAATEDRWIVSGLCPVSLFELVVGSPGVEAVDCRVGYGDSQALKLTGSVQQKETFHYL